MKKISAMLLAMILVMSVSMTVFGATKGDTDKKVSTSLAYISAEWKNDPTVDKNLKDFYIFTCTNADMSKYKNGFAESVKTAVSDNTLTAGNAVLAVGALANLGYDVTDFNGTNLVDLLKAFGADSFSTPFSLVYGITLADKLAENELKNVYAEKLAGYYEIGKGTDFWGGWGTSADDLSTLIIGLSFAKADYEEIIGDAVKLLETYYTADGYTNNGANADSTALALGAYSALGDKEKADNVYDMLIDKFYDKETGGFKAEYDPYYATSDAVYGISFYRMIADEDKNTPPAEPTTKPSAKPETTTAKAAQQTADKNTSKKSPATGASITAAGFAFALSAVTVAVSRKRK